jgi:poly(3-hydroxybutyrate) depolymerase
MKFMKQVKLFSFILVFALLTAGGVTSPAEAIDIVDIATTDNGLETWWTGKNPTAGHDMYENYLGNVVNVNKDKLFYITLTSGTYSGERYYAYVPNGVEILYKSAYIVMPSGVDTDARAGAFFENSGWKEVSDEEGVIVFLIAPPSTTDGSTVNTTAVWNTNEDYDSEKYHLDFLAAVGTHSTGSVSRYFRVIGQHQAYVGYGDGATLLQKYAMANPWSISALVLHGGTTATPAYLNAMRERKILDSGGNGSNLLIDVNEIKIPIWFVTQRNTEAVDVGQPPADPRVESNLKADIEYWKELNKTGPWEFDKSSVEDTVIYTAAQVDEELSEDPVAVVRITTKDDVDKHNKTFVRELWTNLLEAPVRNNNTPVRSLIWTPSIKSNSVNSVGVSKRTLTTEDGRLRHWFEYVPERHRNAVDTSKKIPLLVALAGGSSPGLAHFYSYSSWYRVAEERGFVVVFPTAMPGGTPYPNNSPNWNNTLAEVAATPENADDFAFLEEMIEEIEGRLGIIDRTRVYISGTSAGSNMSQVTALRKPHLFAAEANTSRMREISSNSISEPGYKVDNEKIFHHEHPVVTPLESTEIPYFVLLGEWDNADFETVDARPRLKDCLNYWADRNGTVPYDEAEHTVTGAKNRFHNTIMRRTSDGAPMVRYSWLKGRKHSTLAEEMWVMWDEHLSKFSRVNGEIVYDPVGYKEPGTGIANQNPNAGGGGGGCNSLSLGVLALLGAIRFLRCR